MTIQSNAFNHQAALQLQACNYFSSKLANYTDCSDVYADIKGNNQNYLLIIR